MISDGYRLHVPSYFKYDPRHIGSHDDRWILRPPVLTARHKQIPVVERHRMHGHTDLIWIESDRNSSLHALELGKSFSIGCIAAYEFLFTHSNTLNRSQKSCQQE